MLHFTRFFSKNRVQSLTNTSCVVFHFELLYSTGLNWFIITAILPLLVVSQQAKHVTPSLQDSDGDKSDDLVVDVSNEVRLRLNWAAQPHSTVWALHTNQTQLSFVICLLKPRHLSQRCQKFCHNIGCVCVCVLVHMCVTSVCAYLLYFFCHSCRK